MSVASKVKGFLWTTTIVAVVAVAGSAFLHDSRVTSSRGEDTYTFHAIFTPTPRENTLAVTIDLNGVRFKSTKARKSPWEAVFHLPKGSQVKLEVWQGMAGSLDCIIFVNRDGVVTSYPNHISVPGGCVTQSL